MKKLVFLFVSLLGLGRSNAEELIIRMQNLDASNLDYETKLKLDTLSETSELLVLKNPNYIYLNFKNPENQLPLIEKLRIKGIVTNAEALSGNLCEAKCRTN